MMFLATAMNFLAEAVTKAADAVQAAGASGKGGLAYLGIGIGLGLFSLGPGLGIGKLAASAAEAIARQPESAGDIRGAAIVLAALIEGFTFFGLIIVIILGVFASPG